MTMEAHQPLFAPIDPASCQQIQVEIAGPELQRTLALEVVLMNTEVQGFLGSESLGRRFVGSAASKDQRDTLVFLFPAAPRLKQFNDVKLVFWQPGPLYRSVKAEIRRITIVPR